MRGIRIICGSVAAAALAGCTVGPDFKGVAPATTMRANWSATGAEGSTTQPSQATTRPVDLIEWWQMLGDAQLTDLVERAVAGNLDLRQAEARIRQARASRGVAESAYYPSVNAGAGYARSRSAVTREESDLWRAGFDASWEIDVFGGTRRSVEAAEADIQATIEDRRDVLVTLLGDVAVNYVELRGLQQRIDIAERNLASQLRTVNLVQRKFSGGLVSRLDLVNAEAQAATTRAQIPTLQAAARQAIYNIAVLLGQDPGMLVAELEKTAAIPSTPASVPVGLPSELLRRRPDIRRAEARAHAATARIGVATADLYPRFSLTGDMGWSSDQLSTLGAGRGWSIGPNANWEIFSGGRVQSNIKVQEALRDQAVLGYQKTVLAAMRDVDVALVNYAREQERRGSLAEAVTANRAAVDLAMRLWSEGQVDFLNVLAAQGALYRAEDAYQESTLSVATNLVSLYKALGGGWERYEAGVPATQATTQPSR